MQEGRKKMAKTKNVGALAAAVGMLAAVGLLVAMMLVVIEARPAGATFPGPNGKIAYTGTGLNPGIYTINPGGGGKTKVAVGETPSYSPNGRKIAYEGFKGLGDGDGEDFDHEIYTINVGGGGKSQVTNTTNSFAGSPSWGRRP
jgi:WD40-like Beta Propeller Repeat